uniref:Ig-like domain-containing protein n=1 Tax=Sinocyclocheilus grahami TaxID=75366 RepID=A0A672KW67_SINGR
NIPGQVLTLSCKISGYLVTDSSYCTDFIRQPAGKALEWVGGMCGSGNTYYSDKLKSRFQITREDTSSNTITLQGKNVQAEDTAVYYCAKETQMKILLAIHNVAVSLTWLA